MLKKILSLYPNALFSAAPPDVSFNDHHLFYDEDHKEWVAIPKKEIGKKELLLLKTLYTFSDDATLPPITKSWNEYLFLGGEPPALPSGSQIRFIQFHISGEVFDQPELESAIKGFCSEDVIVLWENDHTGIIIEKKGKIIMTEKEFEAMSETLETDFYVKTTFYLGKYHEMDSQVRVFLQEEKEYFSFSRYIPGRLSTFTYERIFPSYVAFHLPEKIKQELFSTLSGAFNEDPEMFSTILVFLENNSNASLTAKKLYIHRNTLQYRLEKFTEKTGIQLKDFNGAFTVYLACQLFAIPEGL